MCATYRQRLVDPLLDELLAELPAVLLVGPRASGKTTTAARRANSIVRLDIPAEAAAFRADPDGFLRDLPGPVLIDEWQAVPESFGAVKRAVDADPAPGRFLLTGSAYGDVEGATAAGTGRIVRLPLAGMTERELDGDVAAPSFLDQLARGSFEMLGIGGLGLRDYVRSALRSGFPEALSLESDRARTLWLEGYVAQITTRDATGTVGLRDPTRLRRYLEAYALNSAGIVDATTLYEAAGINKKTASAYERILENVFVTETVPAWTSNRLKRLMLSGKRYVTDPGVMAAVLQLDAETIMRDSRLLGQIIDTFLVAQLRGELSVAQTRPRIYHLRQRDGGREVDIVLELGGGRLIGIEVKAGATVERHDARHLTWLRDQIGERFVAGVVFHTGPHAFPLADRIAALPISAIWNG
jgi:uncharacterized protein